MIWQKKHRNDGGAGFWLNRPHKNRVRILALFFVAISLAVILKLFVLQVLRGEVYAAMAFNQHELYQRIFPERGAIYVVEQENGREKLFPLVTNQELNMLYAVPQKISEPAMVAEKIFDLLGPMGGLGLAAIEKELFADISSTLPLAVQTEIKQIRKESWLAKNRGVEIEKLTAVLNKKDDPYEPLYHRLSDEQANRVRALNIDGLAFMKETWRFYPESGMGGQIFGFWGFNDETRKGRYGLEGKFDDVLAGQMGEIRSEKDIWGNMIAVGLKSFKEKVDGSDLVLTLDRAIQYKSCQAIYQAAKNHRAEAASVVVMNPQTGAILAMCNFPDYEPRDYSQVEDVGVYNNPAISAPFEPGSIFKPITLAAALDAGKITPETFYEDTGRAVIGDDTIYNFDRKSYGWQTMTDVLAKSINTGTVWAVEKMTPEVFVKYVNDFGFGRETGVELENEAAGDIANLNRRGLIYAATASYGQGVSVTSIQMVSAVAAIANGGKLMKPYVVSRVISKDGGAESAQNFYPQELKQVISSKTARTLAAMMVNVVEGGHGQSAKIDGYLVAGKTGTANIAKKTGGYEENGVITSFVGFAPFDNPRFVILVKLDRPLNGQTGAAVAAPVFKDIAKFILQYYNVPKDK